LTSLAIGSASHAKHGNAHHIGVRGGCGRAGTRDLCMGMAFVSDQSVLRAGIQHVRLALRFFGQLDLSSRS